MFVLYATYKARLNIADPKDAEVVKLTANIQLLILMMHRFLCISHWKRV